MHGGMSFKCNGYMSLTNILSMCIALAESKLVRDDLERKAEKIFAKEQAWVMKDMMIVSK